MHKVLIIGRIPLPVGGVTIHVSRLLDQLQQRGFESFSFCNPGKEKPFGILSKIVRHKTIHLHISNPFCQLLIAFCCKLVGKRLLVTYHGNWGRYRVPGNWAVNISAWLSFVPIVQNEESFKCARRWNRKARHISTYIPGLHPIPLSVEIHQRLTAFTENYPTIFCTNAWDLTFDKYGDEIYGITEIVRSFINEPELALIISDPSGNYSRFINESIKQVPDNVHFISEPHDFRNILTISDALIRNTTTDGVSLSIYEAKESNVVILASGSVQRPAFCKVFDDISQVRWLKELALGRKNLDLYGKKITPQDAVSELTSLYYHCLRD